MGKIAWYRYWFSHRPEWSKLWQWRGKFSSLVLLVVFGNIDYVTLAAWNKHNTDHWNIDIWMVKFMHDDESISIKLWKYSCGSFKKTKNKKSHKKLPFFNKWLGLFYIECYREPSWADEWNPRWLWNDFSFSSLACF